MGMKEEKCVIIVDGALPLGLLANTAAILGITVGRSAPQAVGEDVADREGGRHLGIVRGPVPILRGDREILRRLRAEASALEGLTVVDFTDLAQSCRTYGEFIEKMASRSEEELSYIGLALYGDKKRIDKLTGAMPLLR